MALAAGHGAKEAAVCGHQDELQRGHVVGLDHQEHKHAQQRRRPAWGSKVAVVQSAGRGVKGIHGAHHGSSAVSSQRRRRPASGRHGGVIVSKQKHNMLARGKT